ncbi:MAG: AMP-binding protein [Neomegalonema sp.]|nr:AMP-binding protein [Neomegalonema sp.]
MAADNQVLTQPYDALETRDPAQREAQQFEQLRSLLTLAKDKAPGLAARLSAIDPAQVTDRAALAKLPLLRKAELTALQGSAPPFGGLTTKPAPSFRQIFMSPGPIFEPGSDAPDWWRFARAFHAAGLRKGDIVHNCFAYHLTPAGAMLESGARALGCAITPAGIGNTEAQITAMATIRPTAYAGTPDYLKVILEKADELGTDIGSLRAALVTGGALFPSLRAFYAERGITCLQCYGTADLGLVAYETIDGEGAPIPGMVVDEGVILEIVRPGTGDPVPAGEVGEVVVTTLNADYPLIRFATGDLSAVLEGPSPCGRTGLRIKGWMGRADQRTKIKGMFVDPAQVDQVVKRHPQITRARVVVERLGDQDSFKVLIESPTSSADFVGQVSASISECFKLRGAVEIVDPGSLPNDGTVIEDKRDYES